MLSSATTSIQAVDESEHILPRRIRHITEIQIRNLTPFPVRDAVTTALTRPAEQSQFPATGVVDDLGAILVRKHSRKASTNSSAARLNPAWEDGIPEQPDQRPPDSRRGRVSSSSLQSQGLNASTSSVKSIQPSISSRTTRSVRGHRPRTSSVASFNSTLLSSSVLSAGESSTTAPPVFTDHSQSSLEKIINSRMVETFIAISIPPSSTNGLEMSSPDIPLPSAPLRSAPISKSSSSPHILVGSRSSTVQTILSPKKTSRISQPKSAPPSKPTLQQHTSPKQDMKVKFQSPNKTNDPSTSNSLSRRGKTVAEHPAEAQEIVLNVLASPLYFSPIHRPSINPIFSLDAQLGHDFPPNCDTSGNFLKLEVWGKVPMREHTYVTNYGRHTGSSNDEELSRWKLLDEKEIHLNELIPLPDDLETNPSQLPSNTVLITLFPPGQTFYLPHISSSLISRSTTPVPTDGYASDPESEIRKAKQDNYQASTEGAATALVPIVSLSRRRRHQGLHGPADSKSETKTASWQDLFKLVNLQSLILDNQSSLGEVVRKINCLLEEDETFPMRREVSERESHIKDMQVAHELVLDQIAHKNIEVADRLEKLRKRSEMLKSARNALILDFEMNLQIGDETNKLISVHSRLLSTRTSLMSTLSMIFPIELYSPPDLLYTILDVPLPIPVNPNDPAPPLSMSAHKDVTEDGVATALGYVAQVLQILAAYIGKNLTYPVTCIGSRSLIRDDISAMVGPRMFPLFSKGVDTYRFEYGVFLLNKDIEMLMSERNLRALDMRHTLPNLKNLLLTLSHDNNAQHQSASLTSTSPTGLETPLRIPSPEIDDVQTPKPAHINLDTRLVNEGTSTTPMASGATTPTAPSVLDDSRKHKSFLGLVPFTDFLRSRHPSTSQAKQTPSSEEGDGEGSGDAHSDADSEWNEEDRMTIHAPASGPPSSGDGGVVAET